LTPRKNSSSEVDVVRAFAFPEDKHEEGGGILPTLVEKRKVERII